TRGLRRGTGDHELRGDVRVDANGEPDAAGGGDRGGAAAAVGGADDDVRGLDLVQLHRAAGRVRDAGGEGERGQGAEVDRGSRAVRHRRGRRRVAGGVGAGEGDVVAAGVAGGGVAVGVLGGDGDRLRGAGGLRRGARDHELRRHIRVDGETRALARGNRGGGGIAPGHRGGRARLRDRHAVP